MPPVTFTAAQIVAHLVGDYLIQSDRMALEKTRSTFWAALHAITYAIPFLLLTRAPLALAVVVGTHLVIDRWRLARYVVWAKNAVGGSYAPWAECKGTGYHKSRPEWLAVWLLILTDNTMHLVCNAVALSWWP